MADRSAGERATIGCIDLAVEPRDPAPDGHTVLAYRFGNRCDSPVVVDLATARVVGHGPDGHTHELAPFDPDRELQAALIDGRAYGSELLAYPSRVALVDVCVDAAAIAHQAPPLWLCAMTRKATGGAQRMEEIP